MAKPKTRVLNPIDAHVGSRLRVRRMMLGIAPRHEPEAVVVDLVNPVGARRGLSAGEGRHGSMKPARSTARRLRIRSMALFIAGGPKVSLFQKE
jgi:hypothetical protein